MKKSKSLIATRKERTDTGERKNKKRKDEEEIEKKKIEDKEHTSALSGEDISVKSELEDAEKKKEEEEEKRISKEYDVYYDTFIAAVKGSRLYN